MFSNLTDTISAHDYNYNTIDLTDLNSGITVAGQTYTMAPMAVSMPTISINSISGANVGYSNSPQDLSLLYFHYLIIMVLELLLLVA